MAPIISFGASPSVLAESEATPLVFTFQLSEAPPAEGVTVTLNGNVPQNLTQLDLLDITVAGGEFPVGDIDFSGFDFTITAQTATISIPIFSDGITEAPTTVTYTLAAGNGYTVNSSASQANVIFRDTPDSGGGGETSTDTSPLTLAGGAAQIAYVAYYGRPADNSGQAFWNDVLTGSGVSYSPRSGDLLTGSEPAIYDQIVNDFGNSAESTRLFGALSNEQRVNSVYNNAFNRDAEAAGLAYWTERLNAGDVTLATFALEVALGAQNADIITLRNKIESASRFSSSINTPEETRVYVGGTAELFGRDWLADFGTTIASQLNVDLTLISLLATTGINV